MSPWWIGSFASSPSFGNPATPSETVARIGSAAVSTSHSRSATAPRVPPAISRARLRRRLDLELPLGDSAAEPLRDLEGLLRRRFRQEDRELLAAEPRRHVVVA